MQMLSGSCTGGSAAASGAPLSIPSLLPRCKPCGVRLIDLAPLSHITFDLGLVRPCLAPDRAHCGRH